MYIAFHREFELPAEKVFSFFKTPTDWMSLFGKVSGARKLKNGWEKIPLKRFPFPLVAKMIEVEENKRVRYVFGGFWRGIAEIHFVYQNGKTSVSGFEYITPHGLWIFASCAEKMFMKKEFERIWNLGWKRLDKLASSLKKNEAR